MSTSTVKKQQKLKRLLDELRKRCEKSPNSDNQRQYMDLHHSESETNAKQVLAQDWRGWPRVDTKLVWGEPGTHHWFAGMLEVPKLGPEESLFLRVHASTDDLLGRTDPQCQVWLNGNLHQALDRFHDKIWLPADAGKTEIHVNAYTAEPRKQVEFLLELLLSNDAAEKLYFDLSVPFDVASRLPEGDLRREKILELIDRSLRALDLRESSEDGFLRSLDEAMDIADEIYAIQDTEAKPTVTCTGHTHIDVAWLWPLKQTREKVIRSFSTALNLMDRNSDFIFMYNQCALFNYLKEDAPELYARVQQKVAEGQFEIEGAMWLEPDVNLISGESMVRQLLYGKLYHEREFGVSPKIVWLPDTFGYSAAMPQILKQAGVDFFVTSKLSWNDTNRMPYDSFKWRGIDGSEINSYLITTQPQGVDHIRTNYGPALDASHVMGAWSRYEPKALNDEVMVCYGHGDGGGGPTQEMIEQARRMQRGVPGCPRVRLEGIAAFFERLGKRMDAKEARFPKWDGELYLEYHRGTLTSLGKNKRNNRLAENRMRDLELLNALVVLRGKYTGLASQEIRASWETVMLNQFHDILPGTSIAQVYTDSDRDYAEFFVNTDALIEKLISGLTVKEEDALTIVNALSADRDGDYLELANSGGDAKAIMLNDGVSQSPVQNIFRANGNSGWLAPITKLPAMGWSQVQLTQVGRVAMPRSCLSVSTKHLENSLLRVEFDAAGEICSIFDKRVQREVLQSGSAANRLRAFEDKPIAWDAWDVDWYFEEQSWHISELVEIGVVEEGPYRAAIKLKRVYEKSTITQLISLQEGAASIEFDSYVDWREHQILLKTEFCFDLNTSEITSEVAFGHVRRPTHRNTSWDQARFEASMHRWLDMSETNFGVALFNDCKYGYDAEGQRVRLSLIKAGIYPFPDADIEQHEFRYALHVHHGALAEYSPVTLAEKFSHPPLVVGKPTLVKKPATNLRGFGLLRLDKDNIKVQAIKQAEEDAASMILRLSEVANVRTKVRMSFSVLVQSITRVDLMERNHQALELICGSNGEAYLELEVRPFEIISLSICFASQQGSR